MREEIIAFAILAFCITIAIAVGFGLRKNKRSSTMKRLYGFVVILAFIPLLIACYAIWYLNRPLPEDTEQILFQGVTYIRDVRDEPRSLIIHVVRIELDAPGLAFLVTPPNAVDGHDVAALTTSDFLAENNLQVAINGDFFDPWRDYGPWDYYPHTGDGVNLRGLTASNGEVYTQGYVPAENYATMFISEDNRVTFSSPETIFNAISGNLMLIQDGEFTEPQGYDSYLARQHPRTAVALDETERTLILIIVDGRQPNYSEGVSIPELAEIVIAYGGYTALNLDGGGSVTLAVKGEDGESDVLNSPIHNQIPGRERPIANHLGVVALPISP
ncbi:MAG: phosphodiester glycosidase family protein [Chitinophagaceae bacterium]|nr:phosphodiester glycosidase family protein [Anaerolineae bacterium]